MIASLVGIGLGIGLAKLLSALMGAIGIDVPRTATVYAPRTFVISIVIGHRRHAAGLARPGAEGDPSTANRRRA